MNQQEKLDVAIDVLEEINSEFKEAIRRADGEEGLDLNSKIAMVCKAVEEAFEKVSIPAAYSIDVAVNKNGKLELSLLYELPL
jgi:hypothetical protein